MHRNEGRSWIAAVVFFAMAFHALLAPGAATAAAVDLRHQIPLEVAATVADADSGAADGEALAPAPSGQRAPAANGGVPYCPYFACAFDLAHAAGLLPASGHAIMQPSGGAPQEGCAVALAVPATVLDANRVRGPPSIT